MSVDVEFGDTIDEFHQHAAEAFCELNRGYADAQREWGERIADAFGTVEPDVSGGMGGGTDAEQPAAQRPGSSDGGSGPEAEVFGQSGGGI